MLIAFAKQKRDILYIIGLLLTLSSQVQAHSTGESYVFLNVTEGSFAGRFEIPFQELNKAVPLDGDGDGEITKEEFNAEVEAIYQYLTPRLVFYEGETPHPVVISGHQFFEGAGFDVFAQIQFDVPTIGEPPETLDADYHFLLDGVDRNHRGLLIIESNTRADIAENESQHSLIFHEDKRRQTFNVDGVSGWVIFGRFVGEGIYHIVPIIFSFSCRCFWRR